jgi:hypothetical protein
MIQQEQRLEQIQPYRINSSHLLRARVRHPGERIDKHCVARERRSFEALKSAPRVADGGQQIAHRRTALVIVRGTHPSGAGGAVRPRLF